MGKTEIQGYTDGGSSGEAHGSLKEKWLNYIVLSPKTTPLSWQTHEEQQKILSRLNGSKEKLPVLCPLLLSLSLLWSPLLKHP